MHQRERLVRAIFIGITERDPVIGRLYESEAKAAEERERWGLVIIRLYDQMLSFDPHVFKGLRVQTLTLTLTRALAQMYLETESEATHE